MNQEKLLLNAWIARGQLYEAADALSSNGKLVMCVTRIAEQIWDEAVLQCFWPTPTKPIVWSIRGDGRVDCQVPNGDWYRADLYQDYFIKPKHD